VLTVVVLAAAAVFGALDQWIGSLLGHFGRFGWTSSVSTMSAPWLLLPFLAGWSQPTRRRAVGIGLLATLVAFAAYAVMTLSPVENAHLSVRGVLDFGYSNRPWLVGALLAGPLFGWFGHRWRTRRAAVGAFSAALAFVAEPLVRQRVGLALHDSRVAAVEVAMGALGAGYVVRSAFATSRSRVSSR
jgi:hypothetical protein